jgi:hypothetical protein
MNCEKCGEECERDEVDVGVGYVYGPWGCWQCGWSEDPRYDSSKGESPAEKEKPGWASDPLGGLRRKSKGV